MLGKKTTQERQPRQKRVITNREGVCVSALTFANICMSEHMWACGVCVWPFPTPNDEWEGEGAGAGAVGGGGSLCDGTVKENTGQK